MVHWYWIPGCFHNQGAYGHAQLRYC